MDSQESRALAEKLVAFNIRLGHWKAQVYDREFNVNGKGKNKLDLTSRQFGILFLIYHYKLRTVSDLVREINISKSSVSLTVSKLAEEGYLRKKQPHKSEDGRKVNIEITAKGKRSVDEMTGKIVEILNRFYSGLTEEQRANLVQGVACFDALFRAGKEEQ